MNLQGRSSIVVRFVAAATFTAVAMVGCSNDGGGNRNPVGPTSPVAQQGGPDLGVASPSVSDSSPAAGASFTLTVAVRNDGNAASAATMLRYYQSPDPAITESDTAAVAGLSASGTLSESVDLTAPPAAGRYYYGACVDAVTGESDTTNNCSGSVQVTVSAPPVQTNPDLTVGSPSVNDSSPETGGSFTLSAMVTNSGDAQAAATTLRYYRSTDATITSSDTQVGTDAVGGLGAGATSSESISLTAPSTAGTYYYGACVDAVTGESSTTNNCSSSVQVTVSAPPVQTNPDLTVGSPSVNDSSPETGGSFTLSATVTNSGDAQAAATTLRYYRSTDATITSSDTQVGTDAVGGLGAGATSSESISLTAPSTAGTYYYGACVDAVTGESSTTNNCSSSVQVDVTEPPPPSTPDLTVGSPSVNDSSPETGGSFTLSATVTNSGDAQAAAATLRYYRSTDATITTSDTEVGTDAVGVLSASGTSAESIGLTAPASAGTYYYGACVDAVTGESSTTNNCSSSVQVDVTEPPPPSTPDLTVGSPSVNDSSPETGGSFTLSATVTNSGDAQAAATTLRYYRSTDATITSSDTQVGTDAVGGLGAGATSSESISLTAPSTAGTYYYGACVDAVTGESSTTNNCSSSVQVDVTEPPPPSTPDLTVGSPSVNDSSPETGGSFTLSATVSNTGAGASAATTLQYYRSADATISSSDTEVGTDAVEALASSGTSAESIDVTAPATAGAYYYGACVDAVTGESDTANNCSSAVKVDVEGLPPDPKVDVEGLPPDLEVGAPTVSDSSPVEGGSFTLSATVSNTGAGASAATTLQYYRSADATISSSDTEVGTDAVEALASSGTSAESIDVTAPATAGAYYYGACVDAVTGESDTADNCSSAVKVDVAAAPPQPASVEVTAPKAWAPVGDTVTYSARVLDDQGMEMVGATVSWSTGHSSVATVNAQGVVTAVEEGTTTVTATAGFAAQSLRSAATESMTSVSGSARMEVVQRASRVELEPSSLSFDEVGNTATLTATVYDASDNEMQASRRSWSSEDRTVATATLLSRGLSASVQAIGMGTTTVTVHVNGSATGSATVTVTLPSARVDISPASLRFEALGDTKSVTVQVLDENGDEDEDATFGYIGVFSPCCDPFLADPPKGIDVDVVDGGLEITAEGPGRGQYTIKSEGVESAILLVTVNQKPASLEVSPSSVSLAVDGTSTLRATVKDANDNAIHVDEGDGEGGLYVYWSTNDENVATVEASSGSATATVTAVGAGAATITGRHGGSSRVTGTATITVN